MPKIQENPRVKVRTARPAGADGEQYVIVDGAPPHYISGYGLCGPGDIVTLAEGVNPGKWLQAVHPKDAAKAAASEDDAQRLAEAAAEKQRQEAAAAEAKAGKK